MRSRKYQMQARVRMASGRSSGARMKLPKMISNISTPTSELAATHVHPLNIVSRMSHLRAMRRPRRRHSLAVRKDGERRDGKRA